MSFKDYLNVYTFSCVLPGSEDKIEFKPLTTKEIKHLLTYEDDTDYNKVEEVLDYIITSSVVTEDFDIDKLYLQDRFYLLLEIRKKTKGETHEFQFDCPKCEAQTYIVQDLDKLETTRLKDLGELNTTIDITDQLSIEVWFITRGEEKEALQRVNSDAVQKDSEYHLNILTQSIKSVISPDGKEENLEFDDRQYIMDNLTTKNLHKISSWFENNNFGVDFRIDKTCRSCGYKEKTIIPMQNFFF